MVCFYTLWFTLSSVAHCHFNIERRLFPDCYNSLSHCCHAICSTAAFQGKEEKNDTIPNCVHPSPGYGIYVHKWNIFRTLCWRVHHAFDHRSPASAVLISHHPTLGVHQLHIRSGCDKEIRFVKSWVMNL